MPVVRTDGQQAGGGGCVRSRDYQIVWDGSIYLPMVLNRRASRARAPLLSSVHEKTDLCTGPK